MLAFQTFHRFKIHNRRYYVDLILELFKSIYYEYHMGCQAKPLFH